MLYWFLKFFFCKTNDILEFLYISKNPLQIIKIWVTVHCTVYIKVNLNLEVKNWDKRLNKYGFPRSLFVWWLLSEHKGKRKFYRSKTGTNGKIYGVFLEIWKIERFHFQGQVLELFLDLHKIFFSDHSYAPQVP